MPMRRELCPRYDPEADAAYVAVSGEPVARTEEVGAGIQIDLDSQGDLVGVEVLSVRERLGGGDLNSYLRGLVAGLMASRRQAAE